jgi:energy-coupling factor transporter transmembrane protein EcfT
MDARPAVIPARALSRLLIELLKLLLLFGCGIFLFTTRSFCFPLCITLRVLFGKFVAGLADFLFSLARLLDLLFGRAWLNGNCLTVDLLIGLIRKMDNAILVDPFVNLISRNGRA